MPICYARVIANGLDLTESNRAELLLGSGVAVRDLNDAGAYVSFQQQSTIICNALRIGGDPGIGLRLGAMTPLSTHGALGLAAVSSRDLGSALDIFVRYVATRASFFRLDSFQHDGVLSLEVRELTDLGPVRHFMHEVLMLTLQALLHTTVGTHLPDVEMRFGYAAPPYRKAYAKAFQLPLQFDASLTSMVVPLHMLTRRCAAADPKTAHLAEKQCLKELAVLQERISFASKVQLALTDSLTERSAMTDVARGLHISTRSLVRRLEQDGTSYRQILEQIRRAAAENYLRESTYSIAEIAICWDTAIRRTLGVRFEDGSGCRRVRIALVDIG